MITETPAGSARAGLDLCRPDPRCRALLGPDGARREGIKVASKQARGVNPFPDWSATPLADGSVAVKGYPPDGALGCSFVEVKYYYTA